MEDNKRLMELFDAWYNNKATEEEKDTLMTMLAQRPEEELAGLFKRIWHEQGEPEDFFRSVESKRMLDKILKDRILESGVRQNSFWGNTFFLKRITVAASVIVILSVSAYFLWRGNNQPLVTNDRHPFQTDIGPGGDKAVLTLADGRKIVLDSSSNGMLSRQGGTNIIKSGGQISYSTDEKTVEIVYNTIATPKGGQFQLALADGTKVWMNAASSLRFPTTFAGKERTVELSGEGYFEVAKNSASPFFVKVGDMQVQVTGTSFNIMAYADEEVITTTLIEGKVAVEKGNAVITLSPGQQAVLNSGEDMKLNRDADTDEAVAWKNGFFQFSGVDIKTLARQIARWYDVEYSFSGDIQYAHISGEVPRNLTLLQVIKVLEESGIDIKLDGRKMVVGVGR